MHPTPPLLPPGLCTCVRHILWYIPTPPCYLPVCVHTYVTYSGTTTPPLLPPSLCTCVRHIQWYIPHHSCYLPVCVHVYVTYSGTSHTTLVTSQSVYMCTSHTVVHPTPPLLPPSLCTCQRHIQWYIPHHPCNLPGCVHATSHSMGFIPPKPPCCFTVCVHVYIPHHPCTSQSYTAGLVPSPHPPLLPPSLCTCQRYIQWYIPHHPCNLPGCVHATSHSMGFIPPKPPCCFTVCVHVYITYSGTLAHHVHRLGNSKGGVG